MTAVDRLAVRLANTRVNAHLRRTKEGKIARVDSYWREGSSRADPLEGMEVSYSETPPGPYQHFRYMNVDDPNSGRRIAEISYSPESPSNELPWGAVNIDTIAVNEAYRGKGIAQSMLQKLHADTGKTLLHGSFSSVDGARLAFTMAAKYPKWNKVWLDFEPVEGQTEARMVLWKPGDPVTGEESTFDPLPFGSAQTRVVGVVNKATGATKKTASPKGRKSQLPWGGPEVEYGDDEPDVFEVGDRVRFEYHGTKGAGEVLEVESSFTGRVYRIKSRSGKEYRIPSRDVFRTEAKQ